MSKVQTVTREHMKPLIEPYGRAGRCAPVICFGVFARHNA